MPQSLAVLYAHVIFGTKNRDAWITAELRPRLHEYRGGIASHHECPALRIGGMPDHVHLLLSMHRDISVSEIVRLLKSE